jgi:hypothetical protein
MQKFQLAEETLGYITAVDETNADKRLLVTGSQNCLIDRNRKVKSRPGFTRLGSGNTAETPVRNAFTWYNSSGDERPLRFYDDEWEVYLGTIDGTAINAWTRFISGRSTTAIPRGAAWWNATENIDVMIFVEGTADLIEWNGAASIGASVGTNTLTKAGTNTWGQNRHYTTGNKVVTNVRTGVDFTYTGGEGTTTLTGVTPDPALADIVAGDIFIQKIVTDSNSVAAGRTNHTIFSFENQICLGSEDDDEVYISQNDDYDDFSFSSPRVSGEGALLTLDGPTSAFGALGSYLVVFAGRNSLFRANYEQITVSTTLAETLRVKKVNTGVDQAAQNQETTVQLGNSIIYLSYEPAVRMLSNPEELEGTDPRTLSNPIKPDFDAETFTNACAIWHKNAYYLSAPANSRTYILEYVEDADGKLRRFWNSPQILPVRAFSAIGGVLHGHSNGVPETYELFTGTSDIVAGGTVGDPDSKVPYEVIMAFAYNLYGDRRNLKRFDEYFVEGEITPNTDDVLLTLNHDFGGVSYVAEQTIDGSDEDILEGSVGFNSLGQTSMGSNPLGGLINPPDDARKFSVTFEYPPSDVRMLQAIFSCNNVDRYFAVIAHGPNVTMSRRRDTTRKK